jgi:hypothetical protein
MQTHKTKLRLLEEVFIEGDQEDKIKIREFVNLISAYQKYRSMAEGKETEKATLRWVP